MQESTDAVSPKQPGVSYQETMQFIARGQTVDHGGGEAALEDVGVDIYKEPPHVRRHADLLGFGLDLWGRNAERVTRLGPRP